MVALRPLDPVADLALLHRWMQEPHVAPWWELTGPVDRVAAYLRDEALRAHQEAWVAERDGAPFGYVETYRAADDPLAAHFPAGAGDRGWHVLVGEPSVLGTPTTRALGQTVVARLLAQEGVVRVLCEPDVRNARMLAWCERLGGTRIATLDLPTKRAALFAWTTAA